VRKQTLTAKLKLGTTPEQYRALGDTRLAYRDALNHVSAYSFNSVNRSANKVRIQEHTYHDLQARFGLVVNRELGVEVLRQLLVEEDHSEFESVGVFLFLIQSLGVWGDHE
jgi:hypothetical protein